MEQDSAADGASSSELPSQSLFRKCINCGLESLPTGEKYPILNLCNACGLYYKYNGLTRSSDKINYRETFVPNWLGTNNGSIGTPSGTSSSELVILLAISNKNNEEIEIIIKNFDEFMHLCNNHGHECCLQTDKGQKAFRLLASEAPTRKFFIELDALILKKKTENGGIEMKLDEMKQRMIDMESIWEQQFSEEMEALKISSGEQSSKSMLYASTDEDKEKFDFICKHLTEFRELCSKNNCNCTAQMENTSITIRLVPTSTKTLEEIVEELDRFVGISQIKEELTEFVQEKEFWEDWRKGVQKIQAEKQKHPSTDRVAPIEPVNHIRFEQIHPICVTKVPHMEEEEMHMCLAICEKRIITWHVGRSKEEALDQLQADYQYVLDLSPFSSVGEKDYDDVYKENKRVIEWMKNNFLCINVPSHGLFVNSIPAIYNICHAHFTNLVK